MKYLFAYPLVLLVIVLSTQFSFAADRDEYWLQRSIQIGDGKNTYGKKVYGKAARAVMEEVPLADGTGTKVEKLIKRSIAVDKPTASKVGPSMLKRIYSPQALLGTAAVTGLLTSIGWVMDEGSKVYMKEIPEGGDFICGTETASTPVLACQKLVDLDNKRLGYTPTHQYYEKVEGIDSQTLQSNGKYSFLMCSSWKMREGTCQFKRLTAVGRYTESKKVPLTAALLGTAMVGSQYKDPDPNFNNDRVNTGDYTGVKEIYERDPTGTGNEVADHMDDKLKNAKPTDDDKSSFIGDPKYDDRPLTEGKDDTSDRGWDEKGDEVTGETKPDKDPVTGEPTGTQSLTLQFPLFCSWASEMCAWYDNWKESDKVYKDHMTKTEEHQIEEKTFWQSTKEWFDWTKEEPEENEENDQPEPDDHGIFSRTFDTNFTLSKQCPPDIPINFESTYLSGSYTFSMNWLCIIFTFMGYPLIFLSHCIGIWILYETVTQKEIKW